MSDFDLVTSRKIFQQTIEGPFPEKAWKSIINDFWIIVENFPKYMALILNRCDNYVEHKKARNFLLRNMAVEARHAEWYIDWAKAHEIIIPNNNPIHPTVVKLHEHLVFASQTTVEYSIACINYAIEGATGEWSKKVLPAFEAKYNSNDKALRWLRAHASYDDSHPRIAKQIIGSYNEASTREIINYTLKRFADAFEQVANMNSGDKL